MESSQLGENEDDGMVSASNVWSPPVTERAELTENADAMQVPPSDVRLSLPIERPELTKATDARKVPLSNVRSAPMKERSKLTNNAYVRKVPPSNVRRSTPMKTPELTKVANARKVPPTNVRSPPVEERLKLTKNADVRKVPPTNVRSPPVKGRPKPTNDADVRNVPPSNVRLSLLTKKLTKDANVIKVPPSYVRPPPETELPILTKNADMKTTDKMKSFILNNKECLLKCVDITSDLPIKLRSNGILTHTQFQTLQGKIAEYDSIGVLVDFCLKIMINVETVDKFLAVLDEAQHKHVANFIRGLGQRMREFGKEWPLSDSQIQVLDDNLDHLKNLVDSKNGLAEHLLAMGCITKTQRESFVNSSNGNVLLVTKVVKLSSKSSSTVL